MNEEGHNIVRLVKAPEIPSINGSFFEHKNANTSTHTHARTHARTHTHHDCNQLSSILGKIIFVKCLFKKTFR